MIVPGPGHTAKQAWHRMLIIYISMIALTIGSALYSQHVARVESARQFSILCDVIIGADEAYQRQPPSTETGRQQAANFHRLRTTKCRKEK